MEVRVDSFASHYIEVLSKTNSPAIFIAVVGMILIALSREYFRTLIKMREFKEKSHAGVAGFNDTSNHDLPNAVKESSEEVVDSNFRLLEKYYAQHLIEYKLMQRATLAIALLGFVVIMTGVFFTLNGKVSVGIITSLAGLISEAASALFFKQNNKLATQIEEYHRKLVSTQYLLTSISLTKELPAEVAAGQRIKIIENLLFLSNELHDSGSEHLFRESIKDPAEPKELVAIKETSLLGNGKKQEA